MSARGQGTGDRGQCLWRAGGVSPLFSRAISRAAVWFVAVALLLAPLFAHGCHGDDVDHEPLFIPHRLNPEDR